MKKYPAELTFNCDETSLFHLDGGRMSYSPEEHTGRLLSGQKERVTGGYAIFVCFKSSGFRKFLTVKKE